MAEIKPRKASTIDGLTKIRGVWPHVFTGLREPRIVKKDEVHELPADVSAILLSAKAVSRV